MIEREEQQQMIVLDHPHPDPPFWQTEWMWTGVVVPIALAWIVQRKLRGKPKH